MKWTRRKRGCGARLDAKKLAVLDFCVAEGRSDADIAALLDCHPKTVAYRRNAAKVRKPAASGQSAREKAIAARRKRVVQLAKMVRRRPAKGKLFNSAKKIREQLIREGFKKVSEETVRRDLRSKGMVSRVRYKVFKQLKPDAEKRKVFAMKMRRRGREFLKNRFAFSDEKLFTVNDHGSRTEWVVEEPGARATPREHAKFPKKVHVWGLISRAKCYFHVYPTTEPGTRNGYRVTGERYLKSCLRKVIPTLKRRGIVFQHDDCGPHRHWSVGAYLTKRAIEVAPWPPRSADLSPIENLWSILARRVSDRGADEHTITDILKEEWEAVVTGTNIVGNLLDSFPDRLARCVELDGKRIEKWKPKNQLLKRLREVEPPPRRVARR